MLAETEPVSERRDLFLSEGKSPISPPYVEFDMWNDLQQILATRTQSGGESSHTDEFRTGFIRQLDVVFPIYNARMMVYTSPDASMNASVLSAVQLRGNVVHITMGTDI